MHKIGIILEVHGTVPLVIPFTWKIPPLFLIPCYLLGIPPLRVVRFPSTLVPGCLCADLPTLSFFPSPFSLSPTVPHFKYMPSYDDITTSASHSPIHLHLQSKKQFIILVIYSVHYIQMFLELVLTILKIDLMSTIIKSNIIE
jgi:hypothetical protein